jgi:phosphoenolpyruvate carboxykinase (ATP)
MLGERIARHDVQCWLVNTGWTGGPYGVGRRMDLKSTRAMVRAALAGNLDKAATRREPVFGLEVPKRVPGVPDALLDPRTTWKDPAAYDAQARKLTALFRKNFEQFADLVPASVREAGPKT